MPTIAAISWFEQTKETKRTTWRRRGGRSGFIEGGGAFGASLLAEFELAGDEPGQFDQLNIGQDIVLDGTLGVSLISALVRSPRAVD